MADALHEKLNDFAKWGRKAFARDAEGDAEDALSNLRKAGEAACKVILLHKLPGKRADAIIAECIGLRDLVRAIVKHGDMDQRSLLPFDAIRAYGNDGAHDSNVDLNEVRTGIGTLRSLVRWLYGTRLRLRVPAELDAYLHDTPFATKTSSAEEAMRQAEEVRALIAQKSKELEQRSERKLDAMKEEARADTKDSFERIERMIAELREQKPVVVEVPAPPPAPTPVPWKWIVPIASLAGIGIAAALFLTRPAPTVVPEAPIAIAAITVPPGGINVLLLPFAVLQDDPNVRMNFEEALKSKMEQRIQSFGLPVKVITGTNPGNRSFTVQEAGIQAEQQHASLVLYGDLYEPTASDSGKAKIHYVLSRINDLKTATMGTFAFRTLSDSMAARVQDAAVFMMDLALANRYGRDNRYSDALALLYATRPITSAQQHTCNVFRAQAQLAVGNHVAALREAERCVADDPTDRGALSFLGKTRLANGDIPGALSAYRKALERDPKNPYCMTDLARVLGDVSSPSTLDLVACEKLVRASLELDTMNALAWQFMADLDLGAKRWDAARDHYARSLALAPMNPGAQVNLADLLAFRYRKPQEAEVLFSQVLQRDSSNARALFLLANLLTNQKREPAIADYLFRKSKEKSPEVASQSAFGQGLVAGREGNLAKALPHLKEAWAIDSSQVVVGESLARTACSLGQFELARRVAEQVLRLDSMAHDANYVMGFYLSTRPPEARDDRRAIRYFERSLLTDPFDHQVLDPLALLTLAAGDLRRAEVLFRKLVDLQPRNVEALGYLIKVLQAKGSMEEAFTWNQKALALKPDDEIILSNQAVMLAALHPERIAEAIDMAQHNADRRPTASNLGILCEVLLAAKQFARAADAYRKATSTGVEWRDVSLESKLAAAGHPI